MKFTKEDWISLLCGLAIGGLLSLASLINYLEALG